jgi:hypothetical protein
MSYLDAINAAGNGHSSFDNSAGLGQNIQSLASSAGVDSSKLSSIADNLKAGLDSGNGSQIKHATDDLIGLLNGADSADSSSGSNSSGSDSSSSSSGDTLAELGKMLESMGLSKDQIDKIINQAQASGVEGATFNADISANDSCGGVKAA